MKPDARMFDSIIVGPVIKISGKFGRATIDVVFLMLAWEFIRAMSLVEDIVTRGVVSNPLLVGLTHFFFMVFIIVMWRRLHPNPRRRHRCSE
jgi:hypothetical protein